MIDPELMRLELFSVAAKYFELSLISGGITITVVTGFLVMAYTIGAQLSRFQAWLASIVFVVFNLSTLYGAVVFAAMGSTFLPRTYLDPDRGPLKIIRFDQLFAPGNISAVVATLIMLGSLYFLYDVRRKARLESDDDVGPIETADDAECVETAPEVIEELPEPEPEIVDATEGKTE